ncbi:hypothetical protein [Bacillus sp. B-jedd]|uniref:hypothetical protein n=1 Tax=Bacillus sp. B-jedd TaxID=1476857 RepID=UPI0005155F0A|nr:hypothetical protein [Bacillus sp. B-jedd]CEG28825.1 hypothetical protein BN1002_03749 [Bacillus sp. B-jedd]
MINNLPIEQIIDTVTAKIYEREPGLLERYGEKGKLKCKEDNLHHFNHLKTAYELNDKAVFTDYALWLNGILTKHGMSTQHLIDNFAIIEEVLHNYSSNNPALVCFYVTALQAGNELLAGQH